MMPNLLALYSAAAGLIAGLSFFAWHNKKTGWVKHRTTVMHDLLELQAAWNEADEELARPVEQMRDMAPTAGTKATTAPRALSPGEISGFTEQLSHLHGALKNAAPRVEVTEEAFEEEGVLVEKKSSTR